MKYASLIAVTASALLLAASSTRAEVKVTVEHLDNEHAGLGFKFKTIPAPSKTDAATKAAFSLASGEADENGGGLDKLHDGGLPTEQDQPGENFFFNAGTGGGRIVMDLGAVIEVKQVNTYSWHPGTRAPQVYKLYGADGTAEGFKAKPGAAVEPDQGGWKLIAKVDTHRDGEDPGGQYGVSIADSEGVLGKFRYLLLAASATERDDDFGNTFYSEIDVIDNNPGSTTAAAATAESAPFVTHSPDGYCTITIDTSGAPDLKEWAETKLAPVLAAWYPKLTALMPSEEYNAPTNFSVILRPGNGVAATGGRRVTANSTWIKRELNGEAIGALVHEEVHVVQSYGGGRGRRNNPDFHPAPGWLVEGIPDYIRFFLYEPQSHGADSTYFRGRRAANVKYDGLYRVSANFLNYVIEHYGKDKQVITKVNAACRQGKYTDDFWKDLTGKTVSELNDEWKTALQKDAGLSAAAEPAAPKVTAAPTAAARSTGEINALTDAEKAAGWKLIFNGKDFTGWHNFRREGVRPGWEVKDGLLVCADPHNAGDIVTTDKYDWFELELDYNISAAGNSGIMYHVTDAGGAVWATGPEFQLEDNKAAADPVRCGWLYALYVPPDDPKTGKPLDATKPVGEWNHVRLVISKEKCVHEINGVKYFEYVLGSEDFNARVAKSKFASMRGFAKAESGYIALQGDHGSISFRNIKVHPLQ